MRILLAMPEAIIPLEEYRRNHTYYVDFDHSNATLVARVADSALRMDATQRVDKASQRIAHHVVRAALTQRRIWSGNAMLAKTSKLGFSGQTS
jgi:hypothetical protein